MGSTDQDDVDELVSKLRELLGDQVRTVGVAWSDENLEIPYAREDVLERYGRETIESLALDLLVEQHLGVGEVEMAGIGGPSIVGRVYDDFLLVIWWQGDVRIGVSTDRDPAHFEAVVDAFESTVAG